VKKTARILVIAILASLLNTVAAVVPAQAAPGKLTEDFTTTSLINPSNWVASSTGTSAPHPCLTALDSTSPAISLSQSTSIPGCSTSPDTNGTGALFLTTNDNDQAATILYNQSLNTAGGLDISFYQAQYGGDGADGISFFVKDGAKTDLTVGKPGGNLGYKGIPGALFGVGFDSYGNWMNQGYYDGACTNNILGGVPKALAIRGPDTSVNKDGTSGFCLLPGGFVAPNGAIGPDYFGKNLDTRASAARPVRILVDPSTNNNPMIRVYMWKSGSTTQDVETAPIKLTVAQPEEYKLASSFKFGFSSSTGGAKDIHAIWGLEIAPLNSALSPTVYVVPNNSTVQAGQAAVYTYKFYSDAAKTVEIAANTLSYPANMCSSSYTLSTNYPASLPITCTGAVAMYNTITTDTATLTVVRGTPSIAPTTRTITGNGGTAITTTAAYTARNFLYPQDLGYTISPALPTGLVFTPATGVISGTTNIVGTTTHTVTATAVSETATATVSITIGAPLTYAYSVTYDKGTGTAGTLAAQTGNGTTVTLSAFSTSTMVKPGYTFSGWLGSNALSYTDAQVLTFTAALTVTLTAQWTANPARTVTYNAGTGTGTVPVQLDVLQGATFTVAAGTGLTKPGYTFAGWKDETGTAFIAGSTFTVATTNVVLTAQWTANPLRTITYNAGTGTGTVPPQLFVLQGATFAVAAGTGLTNPGYTFSGWKDETATAYVAGATYTVATTNVVLTAQWTANSSRTVTYNAGTGTGTVPIQANVLQGATFAVAAGTGLTNPGYTFAGWKDETGTAFIAAAIYTVATTNVVLTAQWTANALRTVTYNAGTGTGTVPTQLDVLQGATFVVAAGTTLTKPGYTFAGWKDETGTAFVAGATFTVATTNVVLTAQWSTNASRTVTYNAGTGTGTVPTQVDVLQGATFVVAAGTGLTKPGYTFDGWKDETGTAYAAGSTYTVAATNVVLTAQWTANPLRTVTYSAGAGTGTVPTQVDVLQGATFVVAAGTGLTKPGYTFNGWKDATDTAYAVAANYTVAATNVVLTAQWSATSQSVTYAANGATGSAPTQVNVLTAGTFTVAGATPLIKAGSTFTGWKDANGIDYAPGSVFTMGITNVTLTAQWLLNTYVYAIAYEANGGTGTMPGQTGSGTTVKTFINTFTKTGFKFVGWKDDAGVAYKDGEEIQLTASTSLVLRAQWEEITFPYAITFDANGGAGTMPGQTGNGSSLKLAANTFTRAAFTFAGWKDDAGNIYADQQALVLAASTSLVLRAQWVPGTVAVYPFAITFDANGGAGVMPGQVGIASTVMLLANKFTRAGYLFNGWKNDAGVAYVDAESITLKSSTTLILRAQWIKNDLGIDNITCLGNFAKSCALKPGAAQPVSFKTNSNQLTPKSIAILKKWKLQNAKSVVIYGYASKDGSKALNDKLTAKRAAEVGAWVKKNWPNLTIKTKGLGTRVNSLCKAFNNKCAMITIVSLNKKK
jgi:uncharacterized repeat protein (TIGR02543 family)